ncbi:MAG: hypothetical protein M1818_001639 [Claussenomyces sp. TS43310]|nr:MAG: hypothetical protein M1818_001639 [Claussenomyces sp. TS43310]
MVSKKLSEECVVTLSHHTAQWRFTIPSGERASILHLSEGFQTYLSRRQADTSEQETFSSLTISSAFLNYLLKVEAPKHLLELVINAFEKGFLYNKDIHALAMELEPFARASLFKTYYGASDATNRRQGMAESALLNAAQGGSASLLGIFGGQGPVNLTCFEELLELYRSYEIFLEDLIDVAVSTLTELINLPNTVEYFENTGFAIKEWLSSPESAPDQGLLATAPISFPLIGLLSLSHYCIACKVLRKSPGEVRDVLHGVTGHSQGIVAAAVVARSSSWKTFLDSARLAIEILFWVGYESHHATPISSLSAATIKDSEEAGEGMPSSMLSIRGLGYDLVENIVGVVNSDVDARDRVHVALLNSLHNVVVAGPPKTLRGLNLHIRKLKAGEGLEQSRVPYNKRKPVIYHRFLPVSAAFHTPYLESAARRVLVMLKSRSFTGNDLAIPVYHSNTADDLREHGSGDIINSLVRMIMCEQVNWPKACMVAKYSHILDFGPGRIGSLTHDFTEGTGCRVIIASDLFTANKDLGSKLELFSPVPTPAGVNWGDAYSPKLVKSTDGQVRINNKMTRVFGAPPVMVAGMTPTTVPWDFVAAVMNAGYHIELAGGGYSNTTDFEIAIRNLAANMPPNRGITCNLIYVNPRAIAWQIPLLRQLNRDGIRIDGLTIGAGIPSAEIAKEYIETVGLKHISFKPGSYESMLQVIGIAKANPDFQIGLQWTGGRAGGHHSFEDFHIPILKAYGQIRKCSNIVLIVGGGFGGADDTYPYLTGEWSASLGYPLMPVDGVLLGSRMMIAKEARTSPEVKSLIVQAKGTEDSEWHKSYDEVVGGVVTVNSEMGQPIHKLATRGVMLWKDLDTRIFTIKDRSKRLVALQKNRREIISRLNNDFAKPWFGINHAGQSVDVEDMTYLEVLDRLANLMYVRHQERWIDVTYQRLILDFMTRAQERLPSDSCFQKEKFSNPFQLVAAFSCCYETAETQLLHPEDVSFFISLCKRRGQKPVNFIPRLDDDFETWFKKDSLWQAEDIDAVINQDAERVCIIQGPVAARHSQIVDEPVGIILDEIVKAFLQRLIHTSQTKGCSEVGRHLNSGVSTFPVPNLDGIIIEEGRMQNSYSVVTSGSLPDHDLMAQALTLGNANWAQACLTDKFICQAEQRWQNPIRSAFTLRHGDMVTVRYGEDGGTESITLTRRISRKRDLQDSLKMSSFDGRHVIVALSTINLSGTCPITIPFSFTFKPEEAGCRLSEVMSGRNQRIKALYANLWIGELPDSLFTARLNSEFHGDEVLMSREMVEKFMNVVGQSDLQQSAREPLEKIVPLDLCIVAAWTALVKPLMISAVDGDLLRLLHRTNSFEYYPGAEPLEIGDVVKTSSHIAAVTIQAAGKLVEVVAEIKRQNKPVVKVTSGFFIQGRFSDYGNAFRSIQEPDMELAVKSEKMKAVLSSRSWVKMNAPSSDIVGKTFLFKIVTQVTYERKSSLTNLHVTGDILSSTGKGPLHYVGSIHFEKSLCQGNPVMDFLKRHGYPVQQDQLLDNPGWPDKHWKIRIPETNFAYSRASGDTNPIHVCPSFAGYAHLPGTVTHGMYTAAAVRRIVEKIVAEGDHSRFRQYSVSFEGMVLPGNTLRIEMQHVAMKSGRMCLKIQAYNDDTNDKVLDAAAEIEQAATAYIFCGQGSQEKGMGMALYSSSKAARAVWDRGDRHLLDLYGRFLHPSSILRLILRLLIMEGFSLLDIVRNDPKSLTVHFGGRRGRKVRENYLAMTHILTLPDGKAFEEPIIAGLTPVSESHTFQDGRGLLFSTQMAQPALTLMELAELAHLREKGLIQEHAMFAGHSLGEYSALGALTSFMTLEELLNLVFYRGLTMQVALTRDDLGRTDFSMVAVNPSRINGKFGQQSFEILAGHIGVETGLLLEVVNYNVEQQQYVCAGHLRALWILGQACDDLSRHSNPEALNTEELLRVIHKFKVTAENLPNPIELKRGLATVPLNGIDIPFHSTYLRGGINTYRSYLKSKILEDNVCPDQLIGKFIPNVTGKPFSIEKSYIEQVAAITSSTPLRHMLEKVSEIQSHAYMNIPS